MEPVRIKLYGLFSLTRRRYVVQFVVALLLAGLLLAGWWWVGRGVSEQFQLGKDPALDRFILFWRFLPFAVLGLMGLQMIEACVVLRLFRRKEAAQRPQ